MSQFQAPVRRSGGGLDVYTGLLLISFLILLGGVALLAKRNIEHSDASGRGEGGVITMIGRAHLQGFGSIENVTNEKASMLQYLQGRRLAIVNADAPGLRRHLHHADQVVLFGEARDAGLRLTGWEARGSGGRLRVNDRMDLDLGLPGRHNAVNALAVVAVARQMGFDDPDIADALAACRPVAMRMSRRDVGAVTFYNDAYNANPDSMLAAMETIAAMPGRRLAVLGPMAELGTAADEEHVMVGKAAKALGFDVITVGDDHGLADAAGGRNVTDQSEAVGIVLDEAEDGAIVLVKASRSAGFERLAVRLIEASQA